jgi:hypothetical protein
MTVEQGEQAREAAEMMVDFLEDSDDSSSDED